MIYAPGTGVGCAPAGPPSDSTGAWYLTSASLDHHEMRFSRWLLGDRSFDHDNDTEREDGIHRMDAYIVADEETVKAADDPHMLDFRP